MNMFDFHQEDEIDQVCKEMCESTKQTFVINGEKYTTVRGARGARMMYNKNHPEARLMSASDADEFYEVREEPKTIQDSPTWTCGCGEENTDASCYQCGASYS